jgi:hydrogenase large subunit
MRIWRWRRLRRLPKVNATLALKHSTLERHAARAIRAALLAELTPKYRQLLVDNIAKGDLMVQNSPVFSSGEFEGVGTDEVPRGSLSHWVIVQDA